MQLGYTILSFRVLVQFGNKILSFGYSASGV